MKKLIYLLISTFISTNLIAASDVFPKTKWGMTSASVVRVYPEGKIINQSTGEIFLRVRTKIFEQLTTVTTFATRSPYGLEAIVAEFPAPGPQVKATNQNFLQPTLKQADDIKNRVVKALNNLYGKPFKTEIGVGGSIFIWRGAKDFVRFRTVLIDFGRVDVRLWVSPATQIVNCSEAEEELDVVYTHTDPSTWSKGGAMKVQWGMGPADVQDVYPEMKGVLYFLDIPKPKKTYSTNAFIEGQVGIHFSFFQGRLFEIEVGPYFRSEERNLKTDKERKEWWDSIQFWADNAIKILTEKYGPPNHAPTPEEEKVGGRGFGTKELQWVWWTNDTGIAFLRSTVAIQYIDYIDASPLGKDACEAVEEAHKAEEASRKIPF